MLRECELEIVVEDGLECGREQGQSEVEQRESKMISCKWRSIFWKKKLNIILCTYLLLLQ